MVGASYVKGKSMKKLLVALLCVVLLSQVFVKEVSADNVLQSAYVAGYKGCYLVDVLGQSLVGPYSGDGYVTYVAPSDRLAPIRFWSYDHRYGYGMIIVRYPANTDQGRYFFPAAIDLATTWSNPMGLSTIYLDAVAMYYPPQEMVPLEVKALYSSSCVIVVVPDELGRTNAPGCVVDNIFIGVSNPQIACKPVEGFAIDHFELIVDGRVVEGNLPDNQFDVWQRGDTTCASFAFSGFWPDSSVGVVVVGSDGLRYIYRVMVRSDWESNNYKTVDCARDESMTRIRVRYGDTISIYLIALGLPVTREFKNYWRNTNDGLITGIWYDLPPEWLAAMGQGVGED